MLIPDLQAAVQAERDRLAKPQEAIDWFADFKDLAAINARLDAFVAARPDLCSIVNLPVTTIQGRTIKGIRIARHPAGTMMPAFAFTGMVSMVGRRKGDSVIDEPAGSGMGAM